MLDARSWMLAKKGVIPYRYPVSRNQYLGSMKLKLLFMAMKR
jgi:hypothetical protein